MKHTWILLTGVFLLASGCQQPTPPPAKPQLLTPPTFALGWQFATSNKSRIANMYVRGDDVFAYTESGTSYVLNRKNGKILQIDDVPAATGQMKAPAVTKDAIAYATSDAVQIYDLRGNLTRTITLNYTLTSGLAAGKDMLFVAEAYPDGGRLAAVDPSLLGGTTYDPHTETINAIPVRWEYLVQRAQIISTPVVLKDAVYVAGANGTVAALATSDREPLWALDNGLFQCGGGVLADLAVDDYGVYVASYDSKLYCLNPNNGKVRWQYYAQAPLTATPVVTKDLVFEFVPGKGLAAIEKISTPQPNKPPTYDRTPRWIAADCKQFLAEDVKYVYLLRTDRHLSARDKTTGAEKFVSKRSDFVAVAANSSFGAAFTPNAADSTIYASLRDGTIVAVNAVTLPGTIGEMVWDDASGAIGGGKVAMVHRDTALAARSSPLRDKATLNSVMP